MAPISAGRPAGSSTTQPALDVVAHRLRCPNCARGPLRRDRGRLVCPTGHGFDLARQGYASLVAGHRRRHRGDDARMVAARERFLGRGHYLPLATTVAVLAAEHDPGTDGIVVDLAGGTGHYLSAVLDVSPRRHGLCVDASAPALRRAARAHDRIAAIGADVWSPLPLRPGAAGVVLSVFGPRNPAETARILGPGGIVVVATPRPTHLTEVAALVGVVGVDPRKPERLAAAFADFERVVHQEVTSRVALRRQDVHDVIAMGPSARHMSAEDLGVLVTRLPEVVGATMAVEVSVYRRAPLSSERSGSTVTR